MSGKIFEIIGPLFRSKKIIELNIQRAIPNIDNKKLEKLKFNVEQLWKSLCRICFYERI